MKTLITAPYSDKAQEQLSAAIGEVIYKPCQLHGRAFDEEELIRLLNDTGADSLIIEHDKINEKLITQFPGLRFIGVCRGTPSNVDIKAATEKGIPVFFTPARNAQAVAEMFVSNVICFYRNTIASVEWLKKGDWGEGSLTSYLQFKGNELAGKTIGMIGFGAVGQRIAGMIRSFPCTIQFYDPYIEAVDEGYKKTSIDDIFETSDIVSIHLPVNESTKGMINKKLISMMKQDGIFVNTARAVVVNRYDLLDALENNRIRGAILDVFDFEPPDETDIRLINLPNVMATPHVAGATFEVVDHHSNIMNEALFDWFVHKKASAPLLANKEVISVKTSNKL